jgi:hypothetical protein
MSRATATMMTGDELRTELGWCDDTVCRGLALDGGRLLEIILRGRSERNVVGQPTTTGGGHGGC